MIPPASGPEACSSSGRGRPNALSTTLQSVSEHVPYLRNVATVLADDIVDCACRIMPPLNGLWREVAHRLESSRLSVGRVRIR
jgi:hypothetical protein